MGSSRNQSWKNCKDIDIIMKICTTYLSALILGAAVLHAAPTANAGWSSLFNGEDLSGWEVSEAASQSWSVIDGVMDCDPRSTAGGSRDLWSENEYGDLVLHVEWRFTDLPTIENLPVILPDGSVKTDENGATVTERRPNGDSGIYLRGTSKAQVNIWNWPVGSGEVYGYRTDGSQPAEVRAGVTPKVAADNPPGEWNTFVITIIGDRLSVILNGQLVINDAQLPDVPERGKIALQYHGGFNHETGEYHNASSLVQFRNMYIKEL